MTNAKTMSFKQAMEYLGITSYNTFKRSYLEQGLPVIVVGSSKRIDVSDLDKFIQKHKVSTGA